MSFKTLALFCTISICALLSFSSCHNMFGKGGKTDSVAAYANFMTPKIDSIDFTIKVPNNFYSSSSLNKTAQFQYNDTANEEYIITICESKSDFIATFANDSMYDSKETPEKNYRMVQMKNMAEGMLTKNGPNIKKTTINGLDAEVVDMVAKLQDINSDIYYKLAFIEGTTNMYMIMTWTLANDKDKNNDDLDNMINSFQLKTPKPKS